MSNVRNVEYYLQNISNLSIQLDNKPNDENVIFTKTVELLKSILIDTTKGIELEILNEKAIKYAKNLTSVFETFDQIIEYLKNIQNAGIIKKINAGLLETACEISTPQGEWNHDLWIRILLKKSHTRGKNLKLLLNIFSVADKIENYVNSNSELINRVRNEEIINFQNTLRLKYKNKFTISKTKDSKKNQDGKNLDSFLRKQLSFPLQGKLDFEKAKRLKAARSNLDYLNAYNNTERNLLTPNSIIPSQDDYIQQQMILNQNIIEITIKEKMKSLLTESAFLSKLTEYASHVYYDEFNLEYRIANLLFKNRLSKEACAKLLDLKPDDDQHSIPYVKIDCSNISPEYNGFCLEKLDVFDPYQRAEAALLGEFTSCCQNIDRPGVGYHHVADGITHKDKGFYVLRDKSGVIIAQCLAWYSKKKNCVVFDTVETHVDYRGKNISENCFLYLAQKLVSEFNVDYVSVGLGWNNPGKYSKAFSIRMDHEDYTQDQYKVSHDSLKKIKIAEKNDPLLSLIIAINLKTPKGNIIKLPGIPDDIYRDVTTLLEDINFEEYVNEDGEIDLVRYFTKTNPDRLLSKAKILGSFSSFTSLLLDELNKEISSNVDIINKMTTENLIFYIQFFKINILHNQTILQKIIQYHSLERLENKFIIALLHSASSDTDQLALYQSFKKDCDLDLKDEKICLAIKLQFIINHINNLQPGSVYGSGIISDILTLNIDLSKHPSLKKALINSSMEISKENLFSLLKNMTIESDRIILFEKFCGNVFKLDHEFIASENVSKAIKALYIERFIQSQSQPSLLTLLNEIGKSTLQKYPDILNMILNQISTIPHLDINQLFNLMSMTENQDDKILIFDKLFPSIKHIDFTELLNNFCQIDKTHAGLLKIIVPHLLKAFKKYYANNYKNPIDDLCKIISHIALDEEISKNVLLSNEKMKHIILSHIRFLDDLDNFLKIVPDNYKIEIFHDEMWQNKICSFVKDKSFHRVMQSYPESRVIYDAMFNEMISRKSSFTELKSVLKPASKSCVFRIMYDEEKRKLLFSKIKNLKDLQDLIHTRDDMYWLQFSDDIISCIETLTSNRSSQNQLTNYIEKLQAYLTIYDSQTHFIEDNLNLLYENILVCLAQHPVRDPKMLNHIINNAPLPLLKKHYTLDKFDSIMSSISHTENKSAQLLCLIIVYRDSLSNTPNKKSGFHFFDLTSSKEANENKIKICDKLTQYLIHGKTINAKELSDLKDEKLHKIFSSIMQQSPRVSP